MSQLFWDAGDVPGDALRAWANKNVLDAIKYFWEEDPPVCWIDAKDDKLVLTVSGPRCQNESYSLDLDVFELLTDQLRNCPANQLPMYAELALPIVTEKNNR